MLIEFILFMVKFVNTQTGASQRMLKCRAVAQCVMLKAQYEGQENPFPPQNVDPS